MKGRERTASSTTRRFAKFVTAGFPMTFESATGFSSLPRKRVEYCTPGEEGGDSEVLSLQRDPGNFQSSKVKKWIGYPQTSTAVTEIPYC